MLEVLNKGHSFGDAEPEMLHKRSPISRAQWSKQVDQIKQQSIVFVYTVPFKPFVSGISVFDIAAVEAWPDPNVVTQNRVVLMCPFESIEPIDTNLYQRCVNRDERVGRNVRHSLGVAIPDHHNIPELVKSQSFDGEHNPCGACVIAADYRTDIRMGDQCFHCRLNAWFDIEGRLINVVVSGPESLPTHGLLKAQQTFFGVTVPGWAFCVGNLFDSPTFEKPGYDPVSVNVVDPDIRKPLVGNCPKQHRDPGCVYFCHPLDAHHVITRVVKSGYSHVRENGRVAVNQYVPTGPPGCKHCSQYVLEVVVVAILNDYSKKRERHAGLNEPDKNEGGRRQRICLYESMHMNKNSFRNPNAKESLWHRKNHYHSVSLQSYRIRVVFVMA
ncbi:MAG: hypothetical protein BWY82_01379 [Verrucomicrobia bacterium ADurb.Bin474]|nr:MAG: hypothetical protein BWY82_01379 [Verrucomicrobia bacterium ADurb.Bin474]